MKKLLLIVLLACATLVGKAQDTSIYKASSYALYVGNEPSKVLQDTTTFKLWTDDGQRVISIGDKTYFVIWDEDSIAVHQLDANTTAYIFPLYRRVTGDYVGKLAITTQNDEIIIIGYREGNVNKLYHVAKVQ